MISGLLRSNTMQFNFGAGVLWFLGILLEIDFIKNNPEWVAILAGITAIINILLRLKTNKAISER